MKKRWIAGIVLVMWIATAAAAADPNSAGLTAWMLAGSGGQEIRLGYEGLLPDLEVALGGRHLDAPDEGIDHWAIRGYVLAHALDAQMLGSVLGKDITLPDGNLYGGLFGEYAYDREDELSGGYVVGVLVDFPKGWQTVVEYQATIFNSTDNAYQVNAGLRHKF
jgi:hypothetical protein